MTQAFLVVFGAANCVALFGRYVPHPRYSHKPPSIQVWATLPHFMCSGSARKTAVFSKPLVVKYCTYVYERPSRRQILYECV